jgi:exo-beta-1,3-glucanase (GH17 family)
MKLKEILLSLIVAATAHLVDSNIINLHAANPDYKPLHGVCHGPFRQGQSPETGTFPSEAQVRQDIQIVSDMAKVNRTYGNDNILFDIPRFCNDVGLDCYVGSWISDDAVWNQGVVNRLIQVSDANYPTTKALLVGNEYLLWRPHSAETNIINLINQTKLYTDLPVSTAETYNVWLDHPNLVDAVDFIGAHIHPYWEGVHIDNAAQHVIDKYNLLKQSYPDKPIEILEVGWPSSGPAYYNAVPSPQNQKKFIDEFVLT